MFLGLPGVTWIGTTFPPFLHPILGQLQILIINPPHLNNPCHKNNKTISPARRMAGIIAINIKNGCRTVLSSKIIINMIIFLKKYFLIEKHFHNKNNNHYRIVSNRSSIIIHLLSHYINLFYNWL